VSNVKLKLKKSNCKVNESEKMQKDMNYQQNGINDDGILIADQGIRLQPHVIGLDGANWDSTLG